MKLRDINQEFKSEKISKPEYISKMYDNHSLLFEYSQFIKNKDIQRIEIVDNSVIMTTRELGIKIVCGMNDQRLIPIEILNFDYYEKENSDMIFALVGDDETMLDIGANIGWYSMCLSKVKKNLKVFAFEPIPKTYEYLVANVRMNGLTNIHMYNHGISNEEGDIDFFYYPEGSGNASMKNLAAERNAVQVKSYIKRLDTFAEEESLQKLDFIKCDVEGAEFFVFQGGRKTIEKHKPVIFTEMLRKWAAEFGYHPNEIINYLSGLGYKCFTVENNKLRGFSEMDENTLETNFFFLHADKHALQIQEFQVNSQI